jgi:hypothetical protein
MQLLVRPERRGPAATVAKVLTIDGDAITAKVLPKNYQGIAKVVFALFVRSNQ